MIDFSFQSGDSLLHRTNPVIKFLCLLIISGFILITKGFIGVIISSLCILIFLLISNLPFKKVFSPVIRMWPFLAGILLMNSFFYNNGVCLFHSVLICISAEGFLQGFNIVLHIFSISILSSIFIRTTTTVEIMEAIQYLISPLNHLGVPTGDISLIISVAIQFIPILFADYERIRKAQIARGADFTNSSVLGKIKSIFPIVIPAFISAFRRADELSLAIEARGFHSENE